MNDNKNILSRAQDALTGDFTDIIGLNRATKEVDILRYSGNSVNVERDLHARVGYENALKSYVENNVAQADRDRLLAILDPHPLFSRLEKIPSFIERFRVERGGFSYSYYMKIVRVPDAPDFTDAMIAFAPITNFAYESTKPTIQTGPGIRHRHCVLVVEDNELNCEMLTALLEDDYDILTAENGEIGLQVLAQHCQTVDCVLLDVNMPVCDGYEFLERARDDELLSQIPVIVATANKSIQDELRCLELGAFDFVAKPYEVDIVKARLRGIIRLHESIDTLSAVEIDELTGAYTRQAFALHARSLIEREADKDFVVLSARLENHRILNTTYGHGMGDEIIRYLGSSFIEYSNSGVVCRDEADRFLAVVPFSEDFSDEIFKHNITQIVAKAPIPNLDLKFGIYLNADTSLSIEDMADRSFAALQTAESDSSLQVAYFAGKAHMRMAQEQRLEAAFDNALLNDEFVVYYQPKCDTQTGELKAAEALVRWKMPVNKNGERATDPEQATDIKMVSPGVFIPLFERDGLIAKLDKHMFRKVCHAQSERLAAGLPVVPVSVNLSRINLYRHDVVETYVDIVTEEGVPFDLVPIELTESVAVSDSQVSDAIQGLQEAGFPIHLDDFGSGFSSYASLVSLPINTVKIDKSLIDQYAERSGKIIIGTSVTLAKALNMQVVAEGVETEEQRKFLKQTACDLIQGYYFSAPVPYERFSKMLEEGHV